MSYSVDIYDKKGKVISAVQLNEELFSDNMINESLIHEYCLLQASNARHNIACVKGRGEISWSGRKLYKQKGTGNARSGGKDSPVRRGWGVAFWPRWEQNFVKWMNKKARKIALAGMITLKAKEKNVIWLKDLLLSAPKTKDALEIIKNIGLENTKILVVLNKKDENLSKSLRNIPDVKYITVAYLNPFDLMVAKKVVFLESALQTINWVS